MGYTVSIQKSTCYLPESKADEAFKILCELNNHNELKHGGRHYNGQPAIPPGKPHPDIWFSRMEWDYHVKCKNVQDIFKSLGFDIQEIGDGKIHIVYYDSKIGSEDVFFNAIGKLLRGEIEWCGEDGEHWKWKFGPKGMKTLHGEISFVEY